MGGVIGAVIYKRFIRFYLPEVLKTGEAREDMMTGDILTKKQLEKIAEEKKESETVAKN